MIFCRVSPGRYGSDRPDFFLRETEVTNDAYARYLARTGRDKGDQQLARELDLRREEEERTGHITRSTVDPHYDVHNRALLWDGNAPPAGKGRHPVALVNVEQASGFCRWLTEKYPACGTFRLPSKKEWLVAAYGKGRPYPWGDRYDGDAFDRAYWEAGQEVIQFDAKTPGVIDLRESPRCTSEPVDARPQRRRPEGLYGMWGNVAELVVPERRLRNERVMGMGAMGMGGGFHDAEFKPHQDYWGYTHGSDVRDESIGFRVLLDVNDRQHRYRHTLTKDDPVGGSVYSGDGE